ncbi:aminopeptidase N-like isoform X2 [Ooceraea biroi]|uniref:aminopeptidase N-like isoform X2 n=1 Tax=Ooceraea biroi TaxID=2015173 RepID=UPI000F085F1E|nr:aminopeptidase N-like isoform X2 [Ooceraea biroi]
MPIVERQFRIPFLQLFLSSIMFTTVIICIQAEDQSTEIKTHKELGYRLLKDVQPWHYNINIEFSETLDRLNGDCEIDIEILKATSNIRLHSPKPKRRLMDYNIKLIMKNDIADEPMPIAIPITDIYTPRMMGYSEKVNILDLSFNQQLSPGNYSLSISYETNISKGIEEGYFIKSVFPPGARRQNTLLATNIQSIEARQLFPCWDEPEFKTTFRIRFIHPHGYMICPDVCEEETYTQDDYKQDWISTTFVTVNAISTYQMIFVLTDLKLLPLTYPDVSCHICNTESNVFSMISSRSSIGKYMEFAGNVTLKLQNSTWYRKLPKRVAFINQYALPMAIPFDFIGKQRLIIYRESLLSYNKELDTSVQKREIASTVARGIVHQMIDNAISPSWWSHLWLNEGLATLLYMEILDEIFTEWRFRDLFVVQVRQDCFRLDTNFMEPLSYEVQTSSEIKSLFSFPIYVKAPVILRMVKHIMGNEFQDSIQTFLTIYYYGSLNPTYLWDMMQIYMSCGILDTLLTPEVCNYTMNDIMETWITTNNYPIVHVHRNASKLFIFQSEEVFYNDNEGKALPSHWLPITFTTWEELDFNNTAPHYWITPKNSNGISVQLTDNNGWIILNLQQTGYYRVKYDKDSLRFITNYLRNENCEKIHVLNRAQLIDDTYYFLMRGKVRYSQFVNLIYYLGRDRDYVAWYPMLQIFIDLSYFLPFADSLFIKQDMRYILKRLLYTLSYDEKVDEDDLTKWLRQEAVKWACIFDDTQCQQIATYRLKEHLEDPTNHKLSLEWREWTYCKVLHFLIKANY